MMHNRFVLEEDAMESRGRRMLTGFSSHVRVTCKPRMLSSPRRALKSPSCSALKRVRGIVLRPPARRLSSSSTPSPSRARASCYRHQGSRPLPARWQPRPAAPPAAASAPLANLHAGPRSCPPAPSAGRPPPRARRPFGSRAGEGAHGGVGSGTHQPTTPPILYPYKSQTPGSTSKEQRSRRAAQQMREEKEHLNIKRSSAGDSWRENRLLDG
nr:uncharacterized protein LOC105479341 [Macaca nemestrina]